MHCGSKGGGSAGSKGGGSAVPSRLSPLTVTLRAAGSRGLSWAFAHCGRCDCQLHRLFRGQGLQGRVDADAVTNALGHGMVCEGTVQVWRGRSALLLPP